VAGCNGKRKTFSSTSTQLSILRQPIFMFSFLAPNQFKYINQRLLISLYLYKLHRLLISLLYWLVNTQTMFLLFLHLVLVSLFSFSHGDNHRASLYLLLDHFHLLLIYSRPNYRIVQYL